MKRALWIGLIYFLALAAGGCQQQSDAPSPATTPESAPPKPGWEYTPEDFGIGRNLVANDWCNRQIDKLREEIRTCFNTKAPAECEGLQEQNSKKIGSYVRARRCAK